VGPILGYLGAIESIAAARIADFDPAERVDLKTRFLFNSELNSRWFVIPGLGVVVMAILSVLLTALAVAREWENGSMELLLSTPVEPLEIIAGKIAPYAVLGLAAMAFIFVIALTVFAVPFRGNLVIYGTGVVLFLAAYLAQGLLISVVTRNQLVAMQVAIMSGLIPANLLSGFIFPIESMPVFFHHLTMIMPARWLTDIARESHLQGATLLDMWDAFVALAVLAAASVALAVTRFKRNVEP
jgi:ABC-2 type transport system permease protein